MSLKNALAGRAAEVHQKAGGFRSNEGKWMSSVMTRLNPLFRQPLLALLSRGDLNTPEGVELRVVTADAGDCTSQILRAGNLLR